jgi:hypothetical protein
VVQPEGVDSAPVKHSEVVVWDRHGAQHRVEAVDQVWRDETIDLALLRVRSEAEPVCALLDEPTGARIDLQTFGYTEKYRNGEPTGLTSEGTMGNGWLKVKDGQVKRGMSGSPVLNLETGAVCGVLKRSRDPAQALGGYVVPITTLIKLHPPVVAENEKFHTVSSVWLDTLSVEQREGWWAARGGGRPALKPAKHLILTVTQVGDDWAVSATVQPGNEEITPVNVDLTVVRRKVARIFRDWSVRGRWPEGDQIRVLGEILSSALFREDIGVRLHELLDAADERLVVGLRFEEGTDPDLVHLPWEHLYLPEGVDRGDVTLATESKAGFARVLAADPVLDLPEPERAGLKVLLVGARPQFGAEDEPTTLSSVLQQLQALPGLTVTPLDTPKPSALAAAIGAGYDVVHYVGYGRFTEGVDKIAFAGDTESGLDYFGVEVLKQCLKQAPPQLLVLQLCASRERAIPADFSLLGPSLIKQGIAALLAYQYPMPLDVAASFNEAMYGALLEGKPLDMAVQEGRYQLTFAPQVPRAPVTPALFLRESCELRLLRTGGPRRDRDGGRAKQPVLP